MSTSVSFAALQLPLANWRDAAERVAAGPLADDFVRNVVDMQVAQREVEAAVKVIKAHHEMTGYLVDTLA